MENIHSILKKYWGYESFRPLQEDIIRSVLDGKDTLALLPTGGGKSICFQVPALATPGLCLVISPLIALMKDQVEHLRRRGITAFSIDSSMRRTEVINTFRVASESNCKFLYLSPERLETKLFMEFLPSLGVNLIAVDEAHCISQWGYDFRPPYLRIAALREELPDVPVLALTASATDEVQRDICARLAFPSTNIFRQSFERPQLSYSAFEIDSKINKIVSVLNNVPGQGIVYCKSRKRTREISDLLNMHSIKADYYHAGLSQDQRSRKQEAWIKDEIRIIVCTNAFGMGIDKPDVRVVIHCDVTDCLENYYQEAGRAGRDSKRAYAVLLYSDKELRELKQMPDTRFPPVEEIRNVYQSLMNYLQVPAGSGEGNYYELQLDDFIKKFSLNSSTVLPALKALEQEELISFNETVFLASRVQFICDKERLFELEQVNSELDEICKTLLRTYEGIFDQSVSINERFVASIIKKDASVISSALDSLHRMAIIRYEPHKDSPQVFFIRNRIRAEELNINNSAYEKRKQQFIARVDAMMNYVTTADCRSGLIGKYFGDSKMKDCGICDNCLKRKRQALTASEFKLIHDQVLQHIRSGALSHAALSGKMKGIHKDKLWEVLRFLQAEEKIKINETGEIGIC